MVVISLTDCPKNLRGDLTKWLLEISPGCFVGHLNARIRGIIWQRIVKYSTGGRAIMVYSTNNEQRLGFYVHGDTWQPMDFDGLKLMLRPNSRFLAEKQADKQPKTGFSAAAKMRTAKHFAKTKSKLDYPCDYIVLDLETTGLSPEKDHIVEIGALKFSNHAEVDSFHAIVIPQGPVNTRSLEISGLTEAQIMQYGQIPDIAIAGLFRFIENLPIVAHNVDFDKDFLVAACVRLGLPAFRNRLIDTLALSRRLLKGLPNYKLPTLAEHFNIAAPNSAAGKNAADCKTTAQLYQNLIKLAGAK
ncbi:MAG: type I-E CRISPR-associated endoribonuclease Cas2e [Clostridiales bacterium]|jgi:CRISPR-associated protein Cas2|nr:type I-E CRISPR-associated endoribonuclease Cas2e [Clostridiales bacterium]